MSDSVTKRAILKDYQNAVANAQAALAAAQAMSTAIDVPVVPHGAGGSNSLLAMSTGGIVPKYFGNGGYAIGTDTVPAMLTPGEFVVSTYGVKSFGADKLKGINNGTYSGNSMYNYEVNVNVNSGANPDEIARAVMTQIKYVDSKRLRSVNR